MYVLYFSIEVKHKLNLGEIYVENLKVSTHFYLL